MPMPSPWILATHNPGKVRELAAMLAPYGIALLSAAEKNLPEPEETGDTFTANAVLKAVAARDATGLPALADDSGFSVEALSGQPGIYSARWAGPEKDFAAAMTQVWAAWQAAPEPKTRTASFHCVLALAIPGEEVRTFAGVVHGQLTWPPRGDKGFGYDPMFIPDGHTQTFGEMEAAAKEALSHRHKAMEGLRQRLLKR